MNRLRRDQSIAEGSINRAEGVMDRVARSIDFAYDTNHFTYYIVIRRWRRHGPISNLYKPKITLFKNNLQVLHNPWNRITGRRRRNCMKREVTACTCRAAVILLLLGMCVLHHTDTSGIAHQSHDATCPPILINNLSEIKVQVIG